MTSRLINHTTDTTSRKHFLNLIQNQTSCGSHTLLWYRRRRMANAQISKEKLQTFSITVAQQSWLKSLARLVCNIYIFYDVRLMTSRSSSRLLSFPSQTAILVSVYGVSSLSLLFDKSRPTLRLLENVTSKTRICAQKVENPKHIPSSFSVVIIICRRRRLINI